MDRIQWIDGLRGIAATIVAVDHFFCGEIKMPFRTFWAEPAEENRRLIQLPPIRFLWAMDAMVPLFMVTSGYAISSRLLQLRDSRSNKLFERLRSSILRRPLRLYLPLILLASCNQLFFYLGMYEDWVQKKVSARITPWKSPWSHMCYLFEHIMDMLNIIQLQWNIQINGHLWTIPLELRGSYIIYFIIFMQSTWRPRARITCLSFMLAYLLWYGQWYILCFISGLILAELRTFTRQPPIITRWTASYVLRSAVALYLMCLSSEDDYPPDYRILSKLQTRHWSQYAGWTDVRKNWHSIGAVCFFSVVMESPRLQRVLTTRFPQYLGRISFPMYLIHLSVYQMWSWALRSRIWWLIQRRAWPAPHEEDENMHALVVVFALTWMVLGPGVIAMADLYVRALEPRIEQLSKSIESWMNQNGHRD